MSDLSFAAALAAGAVCFGAGLLAWMSSPKSHAAAVFMAAMWAAMVALFTVPIFPSLGQDQDALANTMAKLFAMSALIATTLLWQMTIIFPVERRVSIWPPNIVGVVLIAGVMCSIALGSLAGVEYSDLDSIALSKETSTMIIANSVLMVGVATMFVMSHQAEMNEVQWRSAKIYLAGLWIFVASGATYVISFATGSAEGAGITNLSTASIIAGIALAGILFAYSIAKGLMTMVPTVTERLISSSKAKYKLLHRRVYLVEEPKQGFSMQMFSDVLKSRCYDCRNDESFPCESLDCTTCSLPCPCKPCNKYESRAQGLVVTRQFPKDVRTKHFIQTTPIIWLSSVAGKDNMDPAKLSLLTDFLVNFMERSTNGVILVDGIEYLVTSNDFPRVLKALDRWTETAMTSKTRVIVSVDPKAFDRKEIALLERNREVVRPDASEAWRIIPERI